MKFEWFGAGAVYDTGDRGGFPPLPELSRISRGVYALCENGSLSIFWQ